MNQDIMNYRLAELAKNVYSETTFTVAGIDVKLTNSGGTLVIAIRGTDTNPSEWWRNLRIWPTGAGKYYYHSGFWKGAEKVREQLPFYTNPTQIPSDVIVVGHSQGAGIAVCLARQLVKRGCNVSRCVGFGMPRAMSRVNHKVDLGFDFCHYRYGKDIVSLLTPLGLFYKHIKPPIILESKAPVRYPNIKDHSIHNYTAALHMQIWQ